MVRQLSREGSLKGLSLLPTWGAASSGADEVGRRRKGRSGNVRGQGALARPAEPWPVVLVTDVGGSANDPGDLLAIACLGGLEALGFVLVVYAMSTLHALFADG